MGIESVTGAEPRRVNVPTVAGEDGKTMHGSRVRIGAAVAALVVALAAGPAMAEGGEPLILEGNGAATFAEGTYSYDEVFVDGTSRILLRGDVKLMVTGPVTIHGRVEVDRSDGWDGEDGQNGADGEGYDSDTGAAASGGNGADGASGSTGHNLEIVAAGSVTLTGEVDLAGGAGGNGGHGGKGADGVVGGEQVGGGNGGDGGHGATGGSGGGLTVRTPYHFLASSASKIDLRGGDGGMPGVGGDGGAASIPSAHAGGAGGNGYVGGTGGEGGSLDIRVGGCIELAGSATVDLRGGKGGTYQGDLLAGTSGLGAAPPGSPMFTKNSAAGRGCAGGSGGGAGQLLLRARGNVDLDGMAKLELAGGAGGAGTDGGHGGDGACGGDGGDGGSGGFGGPSSYVELFAGKDLVIDADLELRAGAGGAGGRGGAGGSGFSALVGDTYQSCKGGFGGSGGDGGSSGGANVAVFEANGKALVQTVTFGGTAGGDGGDGGDGGPRPMPEGEDCGAAGGDGGDGGDAGKPYEAIVRAPFAQTHFERIDDTPGEGGEAVIMGAPTCAVEPNPGVPGDDGEDKSEQVKKERTHVPSWGEDPADLPTTTVVPGSEHTADGDCEAVYPGVVGHGGGDTSEPDQDAATGTTAEPDLDAGPETAAEPDLDAGPGIAAEPDLDAGPVPAGDAGTIPAGGDAGTDSASGDAGTVRSGTGGGGSSCRHGSSGSPPVSLALLVVASALAIASRRPSRG